MLDVFPFRCGLGIEAGLFCVAPRAEFWVHGEAEVEELGVLVLFDDFSEAGFDLIVVARVNLPVGVYIPQTFYGDFVYS